MRHEQRYGSARFPRPDQSVVTGGGVVQGYLAHTGVPRSSETGILKTLAMFLSYIVVSRGVAGEVVVCVCERVLKQG